jgi:hypothetical protein
MAAHCSTPKRPSGKVLTVSFYGVNDSVGYSVDDGVGYAVSDGVTYGVCGTAHGEPAVPVWTGPALFSLLSCASVARKTWGECSY